MFAETGLRSLRICLTWMVITGIFSLAGHFAVSRNMLAAETAPKKETTNVKGLALELHLPLGHRYDPSDSVDVEILFRNTSKEDMKIAAIEGRKSFLFFDFLIVGDKGNSCLARNGDGWHELDKKPVKLILLHPGGTYRVKVNQAFRPKDYVFSPSESYSVLAIYRDCTYGHGRKDPALWKGVATSPLVPLNIAFPPDK
jgi:hypothetical protein